VSDKKYYKGKDEWFDKYWADKVTPEFAAWWNFVYSVPEDYEDSAEYFVRMSFALRGWLARNGEYNG